MSQKIYFSLVKSPPKNYQRKSKQRRSKRKLCSSLSLRSSQEGAVFCVCFTSSEIPLLFTFIPAVRVWAAVAVVTQPAPFASCPGKHSVCHHSSSGWDKLVEMFFPPNAEPAAIPLKFWFRFKQIWISWCLTLFISGGLIYQIIKYSVFLLIAGAEMEKAALLVCNVFVMNFWSLLV